MESNYLVIWQKTMDIVRDNVPSELYAQWLAPIVPLRFEHDTLLIQVPSFFYLDQIESHYADLIGKSLARVTGQPVHLNYQVKISDASVNIDPVKKPDVYTPAVPQRPFVNPFEAVKKVRQDSFDSQLNPTLGFNNFLEGSSNKLARTAALSIAKEPGKTIFNPLFVHGKSGVGKTHLLHALGNAVLDSHPTARVLYVSAHLFQVQYSQAYLQNSFNDFIHFYQSVDVLLLDDVQELTGAATQNAFFHIFNQLQQTGRQIVFSCDRSPKDLKGFEERLITRFKWGLTAEMLSPDYQLRLEILNNKIKHDGLDFPQDVVEYIARHAHDNVRDLEGITTSIMAHSIIEDRVVNLTLCKEVIASSMDVKDDAAEPDIETIASQVCQYYHLDAEVLQSRSKQQDVAKARQIAMYLAKKHTTKSLALIGETIGKRNHATVIHACKTVEEWLGCDVATRNDIQRIEGMINEVC